MEMNKYYLVVKIFENDKLIHEGSLVNLPNEQIRRFKTKEEAEKFIYDFAIEEVKEGYKIGFEIISENELDKETPIKPIKDDQCGKCEVMVVVFNGYKLRYCPNCGQRIGWDE